MSCYRGVTTLEYGYRARITVNKRRRDLGEYTIEREAANAYLMATDILKRSPNISDAELLLELLEKV